MSLNQSQAQQVTNWAKAGVIIGIIGLLFGNNFYEQITGKSIWARPTPTATPTEAVSEIPTEEASFTSTKEPSPTTGQAPTAEPTFIPLLTQTPSTDPLLLNGPPNKWMPDSHLMPHEMTLLESKTISNREIAEIYNHEDPEPIFEQLQKSGRITGQGHIYTYEEICDDPTGLNKLSISISIFNNPQGAKEAFDGLYHRRSTRIAPVAITDQVGEKAYTFFANLGHHDCSKNYDLRVFSILFQRYNAIGIVQLDGIRGEISERELEELGIRLAKQIDSKMLAEIGEE